MTAKKRKRMGAARMGAAFAVIPALNEERTIGNVVSSVRKRGYSVIVVDDGSSDRTSAEAKGAGAHVVRMRRNVGYEFAISKGFSHADKLGAQVVFTFDADGQHNPDDIGLVLSPIVEGKADLVVGIRPYKQRFTEHLLGFFARRKIGVSDPLSGLKAYRMEVYRKVGYFDRLGTTGMQLLFEAAFRGFRIAQVPIHCRRRKDRSRFGNVLKGNYRIFRSLVRLMRL